jgi:hypothetical protein
MHATHFGIFTLVVSVGPFSWGKFIACGLTLRIEVLFTEA